MVFFYFEKQQQLNNYPFTNFYIAIYRVLLFSFVLCYLFVILNQIIDRFRLVLLF